MTKDTEGKAPPKADARAARLAAELRANLLKRKAQARLRRAGTGETASDGEQPVPSPGKR